MKPTLVLLLASALALASCSDPEPSGTPDASADVPTVDDLGTDSGAAPDVAIAPADADGGASDGGSMDAAREDGALVDAVAPTDRVDAGDGGVPAMFRDETLPEFHITIAPADLTAMLRMGNDTRYPMTLRYGTGTYNGTIRQRLGNNSSCGDLRQFRIDFPSPITFPDGYRTDRFETDRGRCYVLNEWLSVGVMRRVAEMHPELRIHYKYTNIVAIYFNDALYHVETLTEDVNRDLGERLEGTRNVTFYENGCFMAPTTGFIGTFCAANTRAALAPLLDIPTYLQWAATVKALVPGDNYPDYGYNWVLLRNEDAGVARPLGDDWDEVPALEPDAMADPFAPSHPTDDQRAFTVLLADAELRAQYRRALADARRAMDPAIVLPILRAKYIQVRPLLLRVPGLPFGAEQFDNYYNVMGVGDAGDAEGTMARFFRERYDYLGTLLAGDGGVPGDGGP